MIDRLRRLLIKWGPESDPRPASRVARSLSFCGEGSPIENGALCRRAADPEARRHEPRIRSIYDKSLRSRLRLADDVRLIAEVDGRQLTVGDRAGTETINIASDEPLIRSLARFGSVSLDSSLANRTENGG